MTHDKTTTEDAPAFDTLDFIMRFEQGDVTQEETVVGFAELIRTGIVWSLQGFYGRTARNIIDGGLVSREGVVDWDRYNELTED